MALEVKRTTYETGTDKALIVVDVYNDGEHTRTVNNETRTPAGIDNKSLEGFIPKGATDIAAGGLKRPDFTLKDAMGLLTDVIADPRGFRSSVGDVVMGNVLSSMGYTGSIDEVIKSYSDPVNLRDVLKVAGENNEQLKVIIDGLEKTIDSADLKTVNGISEVIGGLTGNTELIKILNLGPSLSIVNGFIGEAMRLELPGAVDVLINSIDDKESKRKLKLHSTRQAANYGDIDFIDGELGVDGVGAGAILALTPDIISMILQNYRLGGETPTNAHAQKLLSVLNKIDGNWMSYKRGRDDIDNLSYLTEASDDAIRVLLKEPATYVAALISGQLETTDMIGYTLDMRPYTPSSILRG